MAIAVMADILPRSYGFDDVPRTYHIRIPENYFIAFIATFLTIAIISALVRTALRIYHYRTIAPDDYILLFACGCLGAAAGVAWTIKDLVYLQMFVGLGWTDVDADFFPRMLDFEKRVVVCSMLVWTAIYAVKLSFLIFFKRLVHRVRALEIHWWVCFGFVLASAAVSIPLILIVCPHFGDDYMSFCPIKDQISHEVVYLQTTVAIDVFTDVLLVSIPVRLLWKLQMKLSKKVMLGAIMSLSVVMIVIAIIRTSMAPLPNGVIDTSWLVFWNGIEAVVAVIMVSLTAFRGLFSDQARGKQSGRKMGNMKPSNGSGGNGRTPLISDKTGRPSRILDRMYDENNIILTDVSSTHDPRRETWDVEKGRVDGHKRTCVTTVTAGG